MIFWTVVSPISEVMRGLFTTSSRTSASLIAGRNFYALTYFTVDLHDQRKGLILASAPRRYVGHSLV